MQMASKRCNAFTLIEIITVLAIVAILTGISFPIWAAVKRKSKETATVNSLKQAYVAIELYRQDNDGAGAVGSSSQLGMPNREAFALMAIKTGIMWHQQPDTVGYSPIYYPFDISDIHGGNDDFVRAQLRTWLDYNERFEGKSIIVADFTHTMGCGKYAIDTNCFYRGFGIGLDGHIETKSATGSIGRCIWWEQ